MRSPPPEIYRALVVAALDEDLGPERRDVTTDALFSEPRPCRARIVARQPLVLCGIPAAREVFRSLDSRIRFEECFADGAAVTRDATVARISGEARVVLRGERTALNFLMRLSGIATATRAAVEEIAGSGARILDTRKTIPGWRQLDKYAVACGGGTNHRMGLHDAVMIKDTHLGLCRSIRDAVSAARAAGHPRERLTVEVRNLEQLREAIDAGAGRALLDNMDLPALREAVRLARGAIVLEASGGLRPGGLREVAETGVDCLSVGWLTHSAPAADLAMEMSVEGLDGR